MILCKLVMSLTIPKMHHWVILEKNTWALMEMFEGFWMDILNPIRFEKNWLFFSTNNWFSWSLNNNFSQACKVFAWTLRTDQKSILHDSQITEILPLRNTQMKN